MFDRATRGLGLTAVALGVALAARHAPAQTVQLADKPARPNIVLIMSDDMGYSDLGCYGGEIETPNLDGLAASGLRFTQFYNTARCCPTRASLLTGLYPHQASIGHMMEDKGPSYPGYRGDLNRQCLTIAEALRPVGYRTYMVGKWHVTPFIEPDGPKHNWPLQRGFERFYGMISGGGSFYDPFTLCRDNTLISPYADPQYRPESYYYTDALSDHAVRFVSEHAKQHADEPFFMYLAYTAAHWPMHALPQDIAKYKGHYDGGYEPIRQARLAKAARLGLIDESQGMSKTAGDMDRIPNTDREIACMEVYAAMIDRMDQGIGRLVAQLREAGQLDNTLIFFLQDNGGCAEGMGRTPKEGRIDGPRADHPTLPPLAAEALPDGLVPPQTRDGYPVRQGPNVFPGPADTYIGYGEGWANVSNTPFREYKHWVHEGGISTPLIVHWPAGIADKGALRRQPGHLVDIMPTCLAAAGATYPARYENETLTPLAGESLFPVLAGQEIQREAIYWEHEGNRAIRMGDWKLVAKGAGGPWELYDIAHDRIESHDLAAEHSDVVARLKTMWEAWAERSQVLPWIWKPPYGETPATDSAPKRRRAGS